MKNFTGQSIMGTIVKVSPHETSYYGKKSIVSLVVATTRSEAYLDRETAKRLALALLEICGFEVELYKTYNIRLSSSFNLPGWDW